MSRLASLSTPTPSRSRSSPSPSPAPGSTTPILTARERETTHHRMLRLVLLEIKSLLRTWEEVVVMDGMKAGKGVVDESTTLDNILVSLPSEREDLVPHYEALHRHRQALKVVLTKLGKLLHKLSLLVDQAEKIYFEAHRVQWVAVGDAMWCTWTLEDFVNSLPALITAHSLHLASLTTISEILLDPGTSFEAAKSALERWRDLSLYGPRKKAVVEWEELVTLEMPEATKAGEEDDDDLEPIAARAAAGAGQSGKKKKR